MNGQRLRQWLVFAFAAALVLGGITLAWRVYEQRLQVARAQALGHLVAIADLKAWQIENWIAERTGDAVAIGSTGSIAAPLRRLLAHPDDARGREAVLRLLAPFKDAYGYDELLLVDANGVVRLSTAAGGAGPSRETIAAARRAMSTRNAQIEDAHGKQAGDTLISVAAPLLAGLRKGEPVPGAVILHVDPRRFLFPAVQQWPVPSASGEAFLVEQHDDTVFYLTPLKYSAQSQAQSQPGRGVEAAQLLAATAVGGRRGALEGVDYRGVAVLGAAQKIQGTDWLVVSQMDAAEVYGPYRLEALLFASLVLMSLLGAGLGTAFWWRSHQVRVLASDVVARRKAESEREKISRMYGALSALNELVARAQSSQELLQGACEIAVASGNFQLAVVRLVDPRTGLAQHAGRAGAMPYRYDRPLDVRVGSPDGASLSAIAYRSGQPAIGASAEFTVQLTGGGEGEVPARSAGAYPLFRRGAAVGVLVLRSTATDAFDGESGRLLERMARDVSHGLDAIAADERLRASESRLRGIVQGTLAPLLVVTREGEIVFANPAAAEVLGREHTELAGLPLGLPLANGRPADVDILLPNGDTRPAEMQFAATDFDGREVLVVSLHDLSERRRYELHIEHLANHDALTGLPNRTLLRDRVQQAIVHARRLRSHVGLMFVDLDQFKLVNDSWGHLMGDALLLEVGRRLQKTIREGDTVARLGGDEFVVLLSDLTTPDDTAVVARKIAEALAEPLDLEGRAVSVTASIGISLYPGDGDDMETLLQCADAAMYRAKEAGRNTFQYYGAEMGAQARTRVEVEAGLRQAIERGELRLHYQPQVWLDTGRICGFEALLRWQHPQRGLVSPASFIPIAEDSGLIVPIGQWALNAACRQAAAWSAGGLGPMRVAVNLSARQFWRGSVTELVRTALGESGLPASQLELEITESVVARDLQQVMLSLEQLRRLGVTVAIDDFGTGYSSLAYLRSLPIQKLKIDRSFIHGIPGDGEATALVGEIVRLAHVLALEVVAEGVETAEQARFLRDAGCEAMQGFLVARPMPGDECAPLLRSKRCFAFGALEADWSE